jgi:hypothetical protein
VPGKLKTFINFQAAVISNQIHKYLSFQLICCFLANYHKTDSINYSGVGGLISGVCYALYPKYQVFTLGLTKTIEVTAH